MTKKFTSILLAVLMVLSLCTMSFGTVSADIGELPEVAEGCNRYYFLAPDDWFNEYSDSVGIYWWEGTGAASSWPGYEAHKADSDGVYYYDVPEDVTEIIWNNYISLFLEEYDEGQWANKQTGHKEWDENKVDLNDCDGKIYVIDPEKTETNPFSGKMTYYGDWLFYYGNGEYGITPEPSADVEYNRYFFLMPEEWYNEYTDTAGIYWWEGTDTPSAWPGYKAHKADAENVYYYDVPKDVEVIIWNNFVDGGADKTQDVYLKAMQTKNIYTEYYEPGESETYPDGLPTFDGMIFIPDLEITSLGPFIGKIIWDGEWYYYYGNGEYGTTPEKEVPTDNILGDADFNGLVTISDATAIQKYTAGITPETFSVTLADVNGDKDVNIKDATEVQKHLAWIPVDYPIGDKV